MTSSPINLTDQQLVFLDPVLMDRARINVGLSVSEFADEVMINYRTMREIYRRGGVLPSKAKKIATTLGCDVVELLAPWDPRYVLPKTASPWLGESEWERVQHPECGRLAANGLYYIVCKMRHRHTPGKLGRGKFYVLSWLRAELTEDVRRKLSRHAEVCTKVKLHPHVAINHTSTPTGNQDGWWVVDEWVGEQTLADHLEQGPWPQAALPRLLHEIALGLSALHASGVVFRELAPSRVLIADNDGRAVLTDFELAKLLEGVPSGPKDWPEDSFRAPEVDGGGTNEAVDVFSFGRLAATAINGSVPAIGDEAAVFAKSALPKRLQKLFTESVSPSPAQRLAELPPLIKELARWSGA